jgi:NADH:ubiquinone reductase (H+-translocating)
MGEKRRTRILILGGGFAGIYAAVEMEKRLARDPAAEVTLVNRENYFLFTPMLHEVAASDLDITHIVNPVRKLLKRVRFFDGVVDYIDLDRRRAGVSHGREEHQHVLEYDHLVLALGSVTNFYGLPGLAERALTMKTLGDAVALRNRLISNLEEADFECCPRAREPLLNLVVAGGGFAGVETVAGVNDFLREAVRFYPHLDEAMLRVALVHPGDYLLPELGEKLGRYAQRKLAERGVEIRTRTRVEAVNDREVMLSDGERIVTSTLVWTAGTSPNPLLDGLPCRRERGRPCTDEFLEVEGWPGVWALGDCASAPDPATGRPYPPTAQHALRQGKVVARNIEAAVRGGRKRPFAFKTLGQLAAIGRRTGVANILGVNFSGFVAWWLWRTIYLSKLPRLEKKLRVALDWTLDLLFTKDIVQFMDQPAPAVSHKAREGRLSAAGIVEEPEVVMS